jgi:hypothetical protein
VAPGGGRIGRPSGLVANVSDQDAKEQVTVPWECRFVDPLPEFAVTLRELPQDSFH